MISYSNKILKYSKQINWKNNSVNKNKESINARYVLMEMFKWSINLVDI